MTWTQVYTPLGSLHLSALVAAIPVVVLLGALAFFHVKAHVAALLGLLLALGVAVGVYGMPLSMAAASAGYGAAFGLLPIGWIILNAIFIYDITVKTGKFEVVKDTIGGLAGDRRIQVLLIAFAFGAFIEGAAGFGTPVAISGRHAHRPRLQAARRRRAGPHRQHRPGRVRRARHAHHHARQGDRPQRGPPLRHGRAPAALFSLIVPFWLVWAMAGFRGMLGVWPACLVAGLAFAVPQFLVSNFMGPNLVDIVAAASCIVVTYLFLKFWQPKEEWRFPEEREAGAVTATAGKRVGRRRRRVRKHSSGEAFMAWMPWIVLSGFVFVWGQPAVKTWMNGIFKPTFDVPWLHNLVLKAPPVAAKPLPEGAKYSLNLLSATGTGLLLAGLVAGLWLKLSPLALAKTYFNTLKRVRFSLLTIAAMLALGFTTRYSGSDSTMGLAFASTGALFPFFSPMLGWLGVALTGSDTSSNVLFGNLQVVSAQQIGMWPILAAASNSSGGVMGKMIDAQSIVVAAVATGQHGHEG